MASSEGSAHSQWRRFFASAGGADIFEIIDAAVAVAALDRPADLKLRRERIAQRLYTGGVLSCGTGRVVDSNKEGRRSMAVSKKEDAPSASSAQKATSPPVKNDPARKNFTKQPPAAAADRNKEPSEPSMEAMLATAKRKLKERYNDCKNAKRQRSIQVIEAPKMAKQHQIIRRQDVPRCAPTKGAMVSTTLRASWV